MNAIIKNGTPVFISAYGRTGVVCDCYCVNPDGRPLVHPWYDVIVDYFENIVFINGCQVTPIEKPNKP